MKYMFLVVAMVLFFAVFCYSQDVRNVKWGMSKQDVQKIEKNTKKFGTNYEENILFYEVTILNKDAVLMYVFSNNKLEAVFYSFEILHTNKNDYIDDFNNLKEALVEKYGEPQEDKILWKNDLYKNDVQDYGMAISIGHLEYASSWFEINNKTNIGLDLGGDNYEIKLTLIYAVLPQLRELTKKIDNGL